jgi:hypothetical protein
MTGVLFMLGRDGSNRPTPRSASPTVIPISHHQGENEKIEKLIKIDAVQVSTFAYLLKKMKETKDGEGSLLDHSLVVYGSSLSEYNIHTHHDLPIVMAGTADGRIKGDRHLVYPKDTALNNLFLNMLDAANVPTVSGFGDSTGRLTSL